MNYELVIAPLNERYYISPEVYEELSKNYDLTTLELLSTSHPAEYTDPQEFIQLIRPLLKLYYITELPTEMIESICKHLSMTDLRTAIISGKPFSECLMDYYERLFTDYDNQIAVLNSKLYLISNEILTIRLLSQPKEVITTYKLAIKCIQLFNNIIYVLTTQGKVYYLSDKLFIIINLPEPIERLQNSDKLLGFGTEWVYDINLNLTQYSSLEHKIMKVDNLKSLVYNQNSNRYFAIINNHLQVIRFNMLKTPMTIINYPYNTLKVVSSALDNIILTSEREAISLRFTSIPPLSNVATIVATSKRVYALNYEGYVYVFNIGYKELQLPFKCLNIESQNDDLFLTSMSGQYYMFKNERITKL